MPWKMLRLSSNASLLLPEFKSPLLPCGAVRIQEPLSTRNLNQKIVCVRND